MFFRIVNDVRNLIIVCCFRGRVGADLRVCGMLICCCFHVVAEVSMVSMAIDRLPGALVTVVLCS